MGKMIKYIEEGEVRRVMLESYPLLQRERLNETIDSMPSANVEEVVRCKDCVCWSNSFEINRHRRCLNTSICTGENFYCAWGSKE